MGLPQYQSEETFTYFDYYNWPDEERWELIDGVAYDMSPAPNRKHQGLSGYLGMLFGNFLRDKPCRYYQGALRCDSD